MNSESNTEHSATSSSTVTLDIKDQKIVHELDHNPRMSTSQLGKKVRLSQQVVDYRIKRLQEQGIITSFGTIINTGKLGYQQYRLLLQLSSVGEGEKKKIIQYLVEHRRVYWAALVGNRWDLFVVVFVRNYHELESFLDELFTKFPKSLKDYEALQTLYHEFYLHRFLGKSDGEHKKNYEHSGSSESKTICFDLARGEPAEKLDAIDIQILKVLKNNCRTASLEIGRQCTVSYKTVQNRIREMEKKEVIAGYRLFLRSEKYHFPAYLVLISFSSYGREVEKKIFSYAEQNPFITQATKLFGRWSLLLHFRAPSTKDLQNAIIDLRNRYSVIANVEIIPIFEDIAIKHLPMGDEIAEWIGKRKEKSK